MSFEPDDKVSDAMLLEALEGIHCELKKLVFILSDVHDLEIDDEDIEDGCD